MITGPVKPRAKAATKPAKQVSVPESTQPKAGTVKKLLAKQKNAAMAVPAKSTSKARPKEVVVRLRVKGAKSLAPLVNLAVTAKTGPYHDSFKEPQKDLKLGELQPKGLGTAHFGPAWQVYQQVLCGRIAVSSGHGRQPQRGSLGTIAFPCIQIFNSKAQAEYFYVEWPASPPEHRFTLERVRGDKATVYVTTTFSKGRFTLPKIKEVFMKNGWTWPSPDMQQAYKEVKEEQWKLARRCYMNFQQLNKLRVVAMQKNMPPGVNLWEAEEQPNIQLAYDAAAVGDRYHPDAKRFELTIKKSYKNLKPGSKNAKLPFTVYKENRFAARQENADNKAAGDAQVQQKLLEDIHQLSDIMHDAEYDWKAVMEAGPAPSKKNRAALAKKRAAAVTKDEQPAAKKAKTAAVPAAVPAAKGAGSVSARGRTKAASSAAAAAAGGCGSGRQDKQATAAAAAAGSSGKASKPAMLKQACSEHAGTSQPPAKKQKAAPAAAVAPAAGPSGTACFKAGTSAVAAVSKALSAVGSKDASSRSGAHGWVYGQPPPDSMLTGKYAKKLREERDESAGLGYWRGAQGPEGIPLQVPGAGAVSRTRLPISLLQQKGDASVQEALSNSDEEQVYITQYILDEMTCCTGPRGKEQTWYLVKYEGYAANTSWAQDQHGDWGQESNIGGGNLALMLWKLAKPDWWLDQHPRLPEAQQRVQARAQAAAALAAAEEEDEGDGEGVKDDDELLDVDDEEDEAQEDEDEDAMQEE